MAPYPRARLLLAVLLLPGASAAFDSTVPQIDIQAMKREARSGDSVAGSAVETVRPRVLSGGIDMTGFLTRLEDMTLDTTVVRQVLGYVDVEFRAPTATANAEYGYYTNTLYVPDTFQLKGANAIRFDLTSDQIKTMIHELTHAAADHLATASAEAGTPAYEHYNALRQLHNQVRDGSAWAFFPNMKSDELSGYFMGCAIAKIAEVMVQLETYNRSGAGAEMTGPAEAERLAGALLVPGDRPPFTAADVFVIEDAKRRFGLCDVGTDAQFATKPIDVEPQTYIKHIMYNNVLGLKPPQDWKELVARLNQTKGPYITAVRAQVKDARLRSAKQGPQPSQVP